MSRQRISSSAQAAGIDTSAAIMTGGGADAVTSMANTAISPTSAVTNVTTGTNATAGTTDTAGTTGTTATTKKQSSAYVKYLLSYEGMVRHQDLEYDATSVRMNNIFKRVQTLGKKDDDEEEEEEDGETITIPEGMLTYLQMRRCLSRIGVKCTTTSDDVTDYNDNNDDDDDVSVLSFDSTSNRSGTSGRSNGGLPSAVSASALSAAAKKKKKKKYDTIIATDSQLILLLITLVEAEEKYRAATAMTTTMTTTMTTNSANKNSTTDRKQQLERGLFLPEFMQAYKLIIAGMQCLKSVVPKNPDDDDEPTNTLSSEDLIHRLKKRTLGLMRPFGPDSSLYNYDKYNRKLNPNLSNGEITNIIQNKDEVLTKIVEEHETEMDALATNVLELRNRARKARALSMKRRRRLRYAAGLLFVLSITAGVIVEVRRRDFLTRELASIGREAERVRDAESIAGLEAERDGLEKKLGVITGKMRYQGDRNDGLEVRLGDVQKEIDNVATKEKVVKREMGRCLATREELDEALKDEEKKKDGVDEELAWCENRLRSRERDLNQLKQRVRDNDTDAEVGNKAVAVVAKSSTTIEGGSDHHHNSGVDKPVQLEMKYNESVRKYMFRRQAYSAVAGFAVSMAFRGLAPMVLKLFAPKVVAKVVPPPLPLLPRTRDAEMIVVDGIFGSSVVFLLVQAVITFLRPL